MRTLLILTFLLLTACHQNTANHSVLSESSPKKSKPTHSPHSENALYDRYKNKHNRYTIKQDGAPLKQKNISFKEPVPAKEPLSRYGNPTEYYVDGHTYEVLKSS
ncbi:MAG: septal ring lytic transglycosylase RlpA family lipoprotein, partial [Legionella sp.]|nr:septal ring lytic transglycosylase RlpA family lipoprotein [Legionella sp.]